MVLKATTAMVRQVLKVNPWILFTLLLVYSLSLTAQTGTTRGREFYISVLPNASFTNDNKVFLYMTAEKETFVSVEIINRPFSRNLFITPNSSEVVEIPREFLPQEIESQELIGIHVTADEEISTYVLNTANATSDATLALPYTAIGDEYIIHTYQVPPPQTSVTSSQFVVLATEDETLVDITFSADVFNRSGDVAYLRGQTVQFDLERGQQRIFASLGDLTGTIVKSVPKDGVPCNKIAVFAGHLATLVGDEGAQGPDHLYSQMYPVSEWSTEYVAIPYATRFLGDPVKVLAAEDNTTVTIVGNATFRLNRGESTIFDIRAPTYIESNKPVSVVQLTKGREVDRQVRGNQNGDPFMVALSPANQIIRDLLFYVPEIERMEVYFVQVVTATQDLQVELNGSDISNRFSPLRGNPAYSHATFEIRPGQNRMTSPNGFVAHAYAFGTAESFAYALGGDLGEFDVEVFDEQLAEVTGGGDTGVVCEASTLTFVVDSDIPVLKESYTVFEWDMGDSTILQGDNVQHQYRAEGTYRVVMTATKSGNLCSSLEVVRTIIVTPDGVDGIDGPVSVCPNAQDIQYNVTGNLPDYSYEWFADGGTIDGSNTGLSVQVDWAISDPNARVRVVALSPNGCLSDTVDYPIVLNEILAPAVARGPQELCSDDITRVTYTTPVSAGSVYTWEATGGRIVAGQGTNTVQVDWVGPGLHTLWYAESTTTATNICDGVSPELEVRVYEPLVLTSEVVDISCFGEEDGQVMVSASGGAGDYTYVWSNGAMGNEVSGLPADSYMVTVTDRLGCELTETIVVSQPDMLSGTVEVQDAICNGESGFATVLLSGGTAPFSYEWSTGVTTTSNRLNGLQKDSYSVRVLDANDCEINLNFEVDEPPALQVSFTMEPACPGVPDGSLSLSVSGGVAPYNFRWEIRPSETSEVLSDINDGTYLVTVTDAVGCSLELTGIVENQRPAIRFPTAFSPNGDGSNDTFGPVFNCVFDVNMMVYNRWGKMVFSSKDINIGWDGNFNGQPAPAGSYTYDITYGGVLNGNPFTETVRGYVRLVR